MAQENYVEGCSMQRPSLLKADGFYFWKARFETYVKSKDIDLWQVIQNGDLYFELEDTKTKLMKETSYELLKDEQKKQLGKNNEAKMTLYNALPRKDLKSLDPDYSNKNHVRKFLRALPLKWRSKVTSIEEAKDLATLPLDELIGNLKVYEMVLDNDGIASKTTKEKVKSLALKSKVTREQTSDDSDSQGGSDEEEEAEAFNLMARNFCKFFRKAQGEKKAFVRRAWSDSEDGDEPQKDATCLMAIESQEVQTKPSTSNNDINVTNLQKENEEILRFNKDFTQTFEKHLKEKRSLESKKSKLLSKINDLETEVKKLVNDKEVVELCKKCEVLTKEVESLKCNVSRLQDEALNFSKFEKSSFVVDDMLSRQKLSQDK
ncbi:zf-CCHC domain-containing protein [Tanacetum coccineum]